MDEVGLETDPSENLANGIHHGRRSTDEHGCFATASRKKLFQHARIESPGVTLEIPLSRQNVMY